MIEKLLKIFKINKKENRVTQDNKSNPCEKTQSKQVLKIKINLE